MKSVTLVREADASDDRIKEVYRDIKESLRVSLVDVMFQAYASNPKFLDYAWRRLRPRRPPQSGARARTRAQH